MPEQASKRALPITGAPIESPFLTEIFPYGLGGLNLKDQLDHIPVGQFAVHTNLTHSQDRGLRARDGLTTIATGGLNHHSVRRLHDPELGVDTRLWGIDQSLRIGLTGAVASIDTGYSGDPLYLLPHRPPLSGDPWMFVADRSRMRKVRADGLVAQQGLPAPGAPPGIVLGTENRTNIADFQTDGSQANLWTPNAGTNFSTPPITTPIPVGDAGGTFRLASSVPLQTAGTGYFGYFNLARALDLSHVGTRVAQDEDLFHLRFKFGNPPLVADIRIYFVVSSVFSPTILPGTVPGSNEDFYVKSFKPADFAPFIMSAIDQEGAAELARIDQIRQQALTDASSAQGFDKVRTDAVLRATDAFTQKLDPFRDRATFAGGSDTDYIEFATLGLPLRRGDFKRYGSAAGRDWSTVTGMVVYLQCQPLTVPHNPANLEIFVTLLDLWLTGGSGPDTSEPGDQSYDYRFTNYDPRTGAEGNPSPTMDQTTFIDSLRRDILVTPAAFGDGAIRQRIYRRGGTLIADWFFLGTNTSDGGLFTDMASDDSLVNAGTVNLDHFQPVPTVDVNGNTVLAQPVPVEFGPAQGLLFALGDPLRPGHLYWCIPDEPDHWPAESNVEVCSPSEELMAGFMVGAFPYCFSRERLYAIYPNLTGTTEVSVTTTSCRRGVVGRWAWAIGLGGVIFGVARDGIFATTGGAEEIISVQVQNLFRGLTWNGYSPVDYTKPTAIRLSVYQDQLFFLYQGTDAKRHVLYYHLIFKYWSAYEYAVSPSYVLPDDDTTIAALLVGGSTSGKSYLSDTTVFADDGVAIPCTVRNGSWNLDRTREEKLLGDQVFSLDTQGVVLNVINRLNNEGIQNATSTITATPGRTRVILDGFGTTPQRARNISTEINWTSSTARPVLYWMGLATIPEPDQTVNRVTQWDDLGHADESYMTGITLDCDTGGQNVLLHFERDFAQLVNSMSDQIVNTPGRRKIKFTWPALPANKVRIRPESNCAPWILYRADWISQPEPPRIAGWDIHFEADGDQYYTGLDLYCTTEGQTKQIQIFVDGVQLQNTLAGLSYWPVTTVGRQWFHLTLPWGRGHVFHFVAIDSNLGMLYRHKWYLATEPSEQANWNQNFSPRGTLADKWFKAFLFEVDTFNQSKTVTIELDGVVVETLPVKTDGRKVVQLSLSQQRLGRILRVFPTDGNPSRPYTIQPIFDEEPYSLTRWETQEGDDGVPGYKTWIHGNISLVSTSEVTLTMLIQRRQTVDGSVQTFQYVIPSTQGAKLDLWIPFNAAKGVKRKYIFQSSSAFRLYREESTVLMLPWGSDQTVVTHPFGNDDLNVPTRNMVNADLAGSRSGGGTA